MNKISTSFFLLYFVLWLPLTAQQDFCGCQNVVENSAAAAHSCCAEKPEKKPESSHCGQAPGKQVSGLLQTLCQQNCLIPDIVVEHAPRLQLAVPVAANYSSRIYQPNAPPVLQKRTLSPYISPPLYLLAQAFLI